MSIKSNSSKATKAVVTALTPENGPEKTDIRDTLKKEHDEVKSLLSDLQDAHASAQRKSLVKRI